MKYAEKVSAIVKDLLEEQEDLREAGSEAKLYLYVCKRMNPIACHLPFESVMEKRNVYGLPQFETVRRVRQKIQSDREDLRGSTASDHIKRDEMDEVLEYVKQ